MEIRPRRPPRAGVLAETLHFGRAAERLHVSQPALSKRIGRMEEQVRRAPAGARLSRRAADRGGPRAGRSRARAAARVRRDRRPGAPRRARRDGPAADRIRHRQHPGLLPKMLLRFRRAYPDVLLQLRDMSTPDQMIALVGAIDRRRFVRRPVEDDRLVMRPVLDERLVAALGPRSPWNPRVGLARWRRSRSSSSRAAGRPASTITR